MFINNSISYHFDNKVLYILILNTNILINQSTKKSLIIFNK